MFIYVPNYYFVAGYGVLLYFFLAYGYTIGDVAPKLALVTPLLTFLHVIAISWDALMRRNV